MVKTEIKWDDIEIKDKELKKETVKEKRWKTNETSRKRSRTGIEIK